jgi:hypothetical protein
MGISNRYPIISHIEIYLQTPRFANTNPSTLFYTAPTNKTILSASMWAENQTRTFTNNQTGEMTYFPSQLIWVTLGLVDPSADYGYSLALYGLPEFSTFMPTSNTNIFNPVNRTLCASPNDWYDATNGSCVPRPMYSQDVWEEPSYIKTRFVAEVPTAALNMIQIFQSNGSAPASPYQAIFMRGARSVVIYGAQVIQVTTRLY